jgi:coenzyme F420 hydrogenase subunit beta
VIGLFCTETFDYQALILGKLKTHYRLAPNEIKKLNVKGKLEVLKQDGSTTVVPLAELETCIRKGCHFCTDLTAVLSDISAGAIGSPPGSTTLIIRTPTGKGFVSSAVGNQRLDVSKGVDTAAIEKLAVAKIKKNTRK